MDADPGFLEVIFATRVATDEGFESCRAGDGGAIIFWRLAGPVERVTRSQTTVILPACPFLYHASGTCVRELSSTNQGAGLYDNLSFDVDVVEPFFRRKLEAYRSVNSTQEKVKLPIRHRKP